MDVELLEMALSAAAIMADPARLGILAFGVLVGLAFGVIRALPGERPFSRQPYTFNPAPNSAIAMLNGSGSRHGRLVLVEVGNGPGM